MNGLQLSYLLIAGFLEGLAFFAVDVLLFEVAVIAEGYIVRCTNVDCKLISVLATLNLGGVH